MAQSRLEKIGTIFSRVTGLVKTGAMKLEDRPLWYQIYQAFPPEVEPRFDRKLENIPIRKIFYPEDTIRAKFYKKVSHLPTVNLSNREDISLSQKCINLCNEIQKERDVPLENAFNEAVDKIKSEMVEGVSHTSVKHEAKKQEASIKLDQETVKTKVDMKDILKDT